MTRIVLTVHHTCRDTMCDDPEHLVSLCQACHLAEHRPGPGDVVRRRQVKAGQLELEAR